MILNVKVGEVDNVIVDAEQARDNFKNIIEIYKKENPYKYAIREQALLTELARLEEACPKKVEEVKDEEVKPKVVKPQKGTTK